MIRQYREFLFIESGLEFKENNNNGIYEFRFNLKNVCVSFDDTKLKIDGVDLMVWDLEIWNLIKFSKNKNKISLTFERKNI